MIVVNVHLDSAISKTRDAELARVYITNVGGTKRTGTYSCVSVRGRGKKQLDRDVVNRTGNVEDHPRESQHVLHLVAKALYSMGYGR